MSSKVTGHVPPPTRSNRSPRLGRRRLPSDERGGVPTDDGRSHPGSDQGPDRRRRQGCLVLTDRARTTLADGRDLGSEPADGRARPARVTRGRTRTSRLGRPPRVRRRPGSVAGDVEDVHSDWESVRHTRTRSPIDTKLRLGDLYNAYDWIIEPDGTPLLYGTTQGLTRVEGRKDHRHSQHPGDQEVLGDQEPDRCRAVRTPARWSFEGSRAGSSSGRFLSTDRPARCRSHGAS